MAGNANSGRRPQPTALKVLRGNPGGRRLPTNEPTPPAADVSFDEPPVELADDALAAAEWRRVAPTLRRCGIVTALDRSALLALCQQWSRYLGATTRDRETAALGQCKALWTHFGMTPSSRSRLTAAPVVEVASASKWKGLL